MGVGGGERRLEFGHPALAALELLAQQVHLRRELCHAQIRLGRLPLRLLRALLRISALHYKYNANQQL